MRRKHTNGRVSDYWASNLSYLKCIFFFVTIVLRSCDSLNFSLLWIAPSRSSPFGTGKVRSLPFTTYQIPHIGDYRINSGCRVKPFREATRNAVSDITHDRRNSVKPQASKRREGNRCESVGKLINNCNRVKYVVSLHARDRAKMTPTNLSFCWSQIAKLVTMNNIDRNDLRIKRNQERMQLLLNDTISSIEKFGPRNIATTCHKLAKLEKICRWKIGENVWRCLESEIIRISESFSAREIANIAWALAKAKRSSPAVWSQVDLATLRCINEFKSQEIANTVWACATVDYYSPELFDKIEEVALPRLCEFNSQDIANTVWAYAKTNHSSPHLFKNIADVALPRLCEFNSQNIANTLWAYAKSGHPSFDLFDKMSKDALPRLHEFRSQAIANTVWAYATVCQLSPQLFDRIAELALFRLHEFDSQDIANTVWAYAKNGHSSPELFDKIAVVALPRLREFSSQAVSNTVWAYAKTGHSSPELFNEVVVVTISRLHEFNSQALANMVWAYASIDHFSFELFNKIEKVALSRLHEFNSREITNMVWAYAKVGYSSPELFDKFAKLALPRLHEFSSRDIANTVWAHAAIDHSAPELFNKIAEVALHRLREFNSQSISNTLWAYSASNCVSNIEFSSHPRVLHLVVSLFNMFNEEELCQLHQWNLWGREVLGENLLPMDLSEHCLTVFSSVEMLPSKLHHDVVCKLHEIGVPLREKVPLKTGYSIDILLNYHGKNIAVEVNGPSRYIGQSQKQSGTTRLKHRQIGNLENFKIVSLPFWEWDNITSNDGEIVSQKQTEYLKQLLT